LEDRGQFPREKYPFSDVDIDPSFPEKPPADGDTSVPEAWLSPSVEHHESWVREGTMSMPLSLLRRETIGEHHGPWLAVHGFVKAADRILGREAWAFISCFAIDKMSAPLLCSALRAGARPWVVRGVPSDAYTFAGEIPWHPNFASVALDEDAYRQEIRIGTDMVSVEVLAHEYAWESYHSEMNRTGGVRVPSHPFSTWFDLRSAPQCFDQFLPDGTTATITLGGVDGLDADILYVREDLLRQYAGERAIVWFAFGERGLRPYPPSPPEWLMEAQRQEEDAWSEVLTDADLKQSAEQAGAKP